MLETTYEIHPLAHLLPTMRDAEFDELKEDIAANGLRESIKLYEGQVLDGRHRYRACSELGLWPTFETYDGDAPAAYVLSLNVKRRQLTPSQKAMLGVDFLPHLEDEARRRQAATHLAGKDESGAPVFGGGQLATTEMAPGKSREQAAELVGASGRNVQRAKRVLEEDPELAERVRRGEITVNAADEHITGRRTLENSNGASDYSRKRSQKDVLENVIAKVLGISAALEHIDTAAAIAAADAPLSKWDRDLTDIIVPLNRLRGDIRKVLTDE